MKKCEIALLRFGEGPFGVFPVAHVVLRFDNGGEGEQHAQVRPDEIEACFFSPITECQPFVRRVSHVQILGEY